MAPSFVAILNHPSFPLNSPESHALRVLVLGALRIFYDKLFLIFSGLILQRISSAKIST